MKRQWKSFFKKEQKKEYYKALQLKISEDDDDVVIPLKENIFKAFDLTFSKKIPIKVVIVGQDPSPNDATGLAFSLPPEQTIDDSNYSINKIFQALEYDDDAFSMPDHGCLEGWAAQGVLLLNSVLTYRDEMGNNAHMDIGWKQFTANVLQWLCETQTNLVFMLWGKIAQDCGEDIDGDHLVMKGYHPAADRHPDSIISKDEFKQQRYFSRANTYLSSHGKSPINWQI